MKVLVASSEIVPFAKTGGLADVCGALPKALRRIGVEADCVLPLYRCVDRTRFPFSGPGVAVPVPLGNREEQGSVEETDAGGGVRAFLVRNDRYFDREFLYGTRDGDYVDNSERFTFFCRAVMEWIALSGRRYDIIHCNDWQTALLPVYVKTLYADREPFPRTGTVFTVHNLGYQGLFWNHDLPMMGLGWELFTPRGLEFYGKINLMKGGLLYADILSTVSDTYSREIQTPEYGYGLEGVLYDRREDLYGIVNGIDDEEWHPAADRWIAANYSANDLSGKAVCRRDLISVFGLPKGDEPVLGLIGRLTGQKGFDLVERIGEWLAEQPLRVVILGSGERKHEEAMEKLGRKYPDRIAIRVAYDNALAHKIEAGSDMYLMPSRYEPCGLNQIYSLKYGTVPIVRETGGLADTVVDADENPAAGTGFTFRRFEAEELKGAVARALAAYADRSRWDAIVRRGMALDFSWEASARAYVDLYGKALRKRAPKG
ncbi:glycogen synthase GlgA [Candidatus Deferrimicrobium sp.]|uniref:glycogen synthase GlgA n=1 Tax=Candidatus Deferrimicrobium sp. TaxID=3060586 RepID=UPI002EDA9012